MIEDLEALPGRLQTERYGRSLELRAETGSTNDDARVAADGGAPDGHVICADRQRAGRGARGRAWESPGGEDLYFSIVARPPLAPHEMPPLTLAVGLGVALAIESFVGAGVDLKWPNDVRIGGLKCAGILVETATLGASASAAIIGVGVDVNRASFSPELADLATSMARAHGARLDRADVLARVLEHVEREMDAYVADGPARLAARVQRRLAWRDQPVQCDGVRGVLRGLDAGGALVLETATGEQLMHAGTLRLA